MSGELFSELGGQPPRPTLRRIVRALRTPAPNERPPGVPKLAYRYPPRWVIEMGRDLLFGRPRSFREDCALAVRALPRRPRVDGLEHVPSARSLLLVANHYQRRDLWIGWPGGLLCDALWKARPELHCHLIVEDRVVLDGASLGWTRWLFARVGRVWDAVLVTPPEALDANTDATRRHALRACLRKLRRVDGEPVCLVLFPEGIRGSTRGLLAPPPGSGRSLLTLAGAGLPILPAAVFEEADGALHARFGAAYMPEPPAGLAKRELDGWAATDAMRRIAALLPEGLRGVYAAHGPEGTAHDGGV